MPIQKIKYIGPDRISDNCIGEPQEFKHDEEYDVDIKYQGSTIVVNGQQVQDPNGIYWVEYNSSTFPYTSDCLMKHWSVKV